MDDFNFDARVIGDGRAGGSLAGALRSLGWRVDGPLGRDFDPESVAANTKALVLAVPDSEVSAVASRIRPGDAVLMHMAGSLGLDALRPHHGVASVHPLVALSDPESGAGALRGAWFATAGDNATSKTAADEMVVALDGRSVTVADEDRVAYHAAAAIASNHLVALLGQVERIAAEIGVPVEAYLDLARGALDNVAARGVAAALTGPVARGDWATVAAHLDAIPDGERPAYATLADAARRLVTDTPPTPTPRSSAA